MSEADWRLDFARHLAGAVLHRKLYRPWTASWDHDHCAACWATLSADPTVDALRTGFATGLDHCRGADYWWVCETCFAELKPELCWTSPGEPGDAPSTDG